MAAQIDMLQALVHSDELGPAAVQIALGPLHVATLS